MSTRATYLFQATDLTPSVCFYIHYDGYPEGAAHYFRNMIACKNDRGGMPARFMRGNDLAEFTGGHDRHGDTEYQYTIDGEFLQVNAVQSSGKAVGIFAGSLYDFVNSHRGEGEEKIIQVRVQYAQRWMLESDAIAAVEAMRKSGLEYACKWGECGNTSSSLDDFQKAADGLAETLGAEHPETERLLDQVHTLKDIRAAVAHQTKEWVSDRTNNELNHIALEAGWEGGFGSNALQFLTARAYRQELGRE